MNGKNFKAAQAALGNNNKQMAADLGVCDRTVKNYRRWGCPERVANMIRMITTLAKLQEIRQRRGR